MTAHRSRVCQFVIDCDDLVPTTPTAGRRERWRAQPRVSREAVERPGGTAQG
jgi:hypothetical protein